MTCNTSRTVHTIGHSTRSIDAFLGLLDAHSIELLIDVRRWPASQTKPAIPARSIGKLAARKQSNLSLAR